jgi:hypothetical protein
MMFRFMSLKLLVTGLTAGFLLLVGFQFAGLPFLPDARFSDAAVSHWSAAQHLRQSIVEGGRFPLWRETIMGGQPFAANPLNKTAYPLQWLALILEPALFLNLMIILHLLIAGLGMWRWVRSIGLRDEAALISALGYMLAPKMVGHLGAGHVDVVYALAWWPWLMWSMHGLVSTRQGRPVGWVMRVGVLAALVFLADVRLSLFAFGLAAAYGLWMIGLTSQWRRVMWFAPAFGLVIVLTLSVTVPLLGWQPYLNRGDLTPPEAGTHSLEAGQLLGLVLPPHSGTPETLTYMGLSLLLLAGIGALSAPRQHAFWLAALLVAGLWALGVNGPLWPLLVSIAPGLLWFRVPARAWFVVVLVICLLAGYGLQRLLVIAERLHAGGEIPRLVMKRLAASGGMSAALFCGGFTLAVLRDLPGTIGAGVVMIGLLLGIVLLLVLYGRLKPAHVAIALLLVVFTDLAWTGRQWVEWRGSDQWLTHQQVLASWLAQQEPGRIYSPNYALEQQVAAAHDLRLFYGVDPFQIADVVDALAKASGVMTGRYSVVQPPLTGVTADADIERANCNLEINREQRVLLAEWGVRYIVSRCPLVLPGSTGGTLIEPAVVADRAYVYVNPEFSDESPSFFTGWPPAIRPSGETIDSLHLATLLAALISGIGLVISLLAIGVFRKHA